MGSVIYSGGHPQAGYSMSSGSGYKQWSLVRGKKAAIPSPGYMGMSLTPGSSCQEHQPSCLLRHHKANKFKLAKSKLILSCDLQ